MTADVRPADPVAAVTHPDPYPYYASLVAEMTGIVPLLLLDEVVAHLDPNRRRALFDELAKLGAQVWMSGADPAAFADVGASGVPRLTSNTPIRAARSCSNLGSGRYRDMRQDAGRHAPLSPARSATPPPFRPRCAAGSMRSRAAWR